MDWTRKHFTKSKDDLFSFFIVFGEFGNDINISAAEYNFTELPENTEIQKYHDGAAPDFRDGFRAGYLWDELLIENQKLARTVENASSCMVISTETPDQQSLDYLRNIIGVVTYFLDNGGVCVYEPQRFQWWGPDKWREQVFLPKKPMPYEHSIILVSEQDNGNLWFHTRGLRLFSRPDISVHDVTEEYKEKVHEMINRFIEYQAFGGIIENGKNIVMEGLPNSMWCEHKGSHDDPDFNNKHIEIHWS